MAEKTEGKKQVAYRIDMAVLEKFEEVLRVLKDDFGESITREAAVEFLMEDAIRLKPKEFLARFYAYKSDKFSKVLGEKLQTIAKKGG